MKIIALENDNLIVEDIENIPTDATEVQKFMMHSRYSPPNSGPKETIIIRVDTGRPFFEVKKDLMEYLGTNRIYIRPNEWKCNEVNSIGFLTDYNPSLTWREDGKTKLDDHLNQIIGGTIPEFKIVRMPKAFGNGEDRIKTQVGEIQCAAEDAKALKAIFTSSAYTKKCEFRFIPEGVLQISGPEIYKNILKSQNRFMNGQKTIPIDYLSDDVLHNIIDDNMKSIEEHIIDGANEAKEMRIQIHRTSMTKTQGRWLIACAGEYIEKVRVHVHYVLTSVLPMIVKNDPTYSDADYLFGTESPDIAGRPKLEPGMQDCFSTITSEFANKATEDPNDQEIQAHKKRRTGTVSYAEVTMGKTATLPTSTLTVSTQEPKTTTKEIEGLIASQLAAQLKITKELIQAQDDKMDKRFAEQENKTNDKFNQMLTFFQSSQENTLRDMFAAMETRTGEQIALANAPMMELLNKNNEHQYPRAKNRMEIEPNPQGLKYLKPTDNSDSAADDTEMSSSSNNK